MVDCSAAQPDHEKHSGGAQRQGADSPREPSCRLPHDALRTLLLVYLRRSLHAYAGVWAGVVIEGYESGYAFQCVLIRLKALLAVYDLRLQNTIHTLRYSVVRGFVVLRHANLYLVLL